MADLVAQLSQCRRSMPNALLSVLLVALLLQHPLHTSDLITSCYSQVSSVLVTIRSHASCTGEYQNNGVSFYLVMLYKAGKIHNCCVSCDDNSTELFTMFGFYQTAMTTSDHRRHVQTPGCLVELPATPELNYLNDVTLSLVTRIAEYTVRIPALDSRYGFTNNSGHMVGTSDMKKVKSNIPTVALPPNSRPQLM